ncbi:MAG: sugar phosphate isomerase/epimerase family protein [Verrucomicrobiota bacterium]|nr:sugar phosphate isomerase/epimerase [Limisphaera sp.]MDW8382052.1 sugar phosphate isomerase/epimerase family protein [Verrucomicrobiota bacterium]
MKTSRRRFLTLTAFGLAATTSPEHAFPQRVPKSPQPARLRLSCQEGVAPGRSLNEKLDFLEAHGFEGIEPWGGGLPGRVEEFQKALQGRKIRVSAVCAGFEGVLISENEEVRQKAIRSIREILTAAGALGAVGMIVVPAFNGQTKLGHVEARELLVRLLPELGEHAHKVGTRILLEPLNRREAWFLRQLADAAAICRDVNHPGVAMMGDFWHMTWEEPSDFAAFVAAGPYLRHVHIASRKERKMPGEDPGDDYTDGMRGLKLIGYQDFISFECGSKGDPRRSIPEAVRLLREQWEAA